MSEQLDTRSKEKYLTPLDVWALAFGCMVGWGAFVMPGSTFLPVAGPAGTIISMAIGLVIMLIIGSCISYLMRRSAMAGGIYSYTKDALGRDHAFLCSWFLCLSYLTIVFLNGTALFLVLRAVLGDAVHQGFSYTIAGKPVYLYEVLLSMVALVGIGFLLLAAKIVLMRFATLLAVILFAGIVVTTAICLPHANLHDIFGTFGYEGVNRGYAIFSLVILAPWAFVGFEVVSFDTAHFKFSVRKSKKIIFSAIVVAALAYTSMTLVSVSVRPDGFGSWPEYIRSLDKLSGIDSVPTFFVAREVMGTTGLVVIVITAMAAILTGIIGAYRAIVNLLSTMAEDKILSSKFTSTRNCILFVMALSVIISLLGRNTLSWFIDLTAFGAIVAYCYTSAVAYKIAKTEKNYRIMAAGLVGTVISAIFGIAQIVPHLVAMDAMCCEAFLLLSLWCLLGFVFYWRTVRRSSLAEYSDMATSGLVLFTLLLYTALMWLGKLLMRQKTIESVHRSLIYGGVVLILIVFIGLIVMLYIQHLVRKMHETAAREQIRNAESNFARSHFLLNISHDIRTPMDAIIGYITLAQREPDFMLRDYLKKIEKSGRQLQMLLNDILEMSRIENGSFEQEYRPTDLCLSFEEMNELFADRMKKKRINFSVRTDQIRNRYVWCDRKSLKHVLQNLISNSFKFTPEGGAISASIYETGTGENGTSSYELRFQDTGIGMPKEFAANMFTTSERDRTSDGRLEGSGLGLVMTKSIIDRMGGGIEVFTAPGSGTKIVIRIDFRLASANDVRKELAIEKAPGI